jgi:phosphonate transport system permease protein
VNVRAGVVLGPVGAGGIGYVLSTAMSGLDYPRACMATLMTLALVFFAERLSDFLRERVLNAGQHGGHRR